MNNKQLLESVKNREGVLANPIRYGLNTPEKLRYVKMD